MRGDELAFRYDGNRPDGITIRELFAAMAMVGYLASETETCSFPQRSGLANAAVVVADGLLAELEKSDA